MKPQNKAATNKNFLLVLTESKHQVDPQGGKIDAD
jgi:hypothetical protein